MPFENRIFLKFFGDKWRLMWYTHLKFMLKTVFKGIANKPLERVYVRLNSTGCYEKFQISARWRFCINFIKLLEQLRGQRHLIRCDIPELQLLQGFRTKGFGGEFIRRAPA